MKKNIFAIAILMVTAFAFFSCGGASPAKDFVYEMAPDGEGILIKSYKGKSSKVVIPKKIEGIPVTHIGHEREGYLIEFAPVFSDSVKKITVPKTVKIIYPYAFCASKSFGGSNAFKGEIDIDISNLKEIGERAFLGAKLNPRKITISKDTKIDSFAFIGSNITEVIIEEGRTELGVSWSETVPMSSLFSGCESLKSVTLPASLKTIHSPQFAYCVSLEKVNIPKNAVIEYENRFEDSPNVLLGQGGAFQGCTSLSLAEREKIKATGYTGEF